MKKLKLGEADYTELDETEEVLVLAGKYLDAGILTKKSSRDCQHIAYACAYDCVMRKFKQLLILYKPYICFTMYCICAHKGV